MKEGVPWAGSSVESGRWEVGLGCQPGEGGHTRVGGQEVNVCEVTLTPSQLGGGVGPVSSAHSLPAHTGGSPLGPRTWAQLATLHPRSPDPRPRVPSHRQMAQALLWPQSRPSSDNLQRYRPGDRSGRF